jgi:hypothetical protein
MLRCVLVAVCIAAAAADVCPAAHTQLTVFENEPNVSLAGFRQVPGFAARYEDTNHTGKPEDMRPQVVQLLGLVAQTCRGKTSGQFFPIVRTGIGGVLKPRTALTSAQATVAIVDAASLFTTGSLVYPEAALAKRWFLTSAAFYEHQWDVLRAPNKVLLSSFASTSDLCGVQDTPSNMQTFGLQDTDTVHGAWHQLSTHESVLITDAALKTYSTASSAKSPWDDCRDAGWTPQRCRDIMSILYTVDQELFTTLSDRTFACTAVGPYPATYWDDVNTYIRTVPVAQKCNTAVYKTLRSQYLRWLSPAAP